MLFFCSSEDKTPEEGGKVESEVDHEDKIFRENGTSIPSVNQESYLPEDALETAGMYITIYIPSALGELAV